MIQAGLATGSDVTTIGSGGPVPLITSLTWQGQEFIDSARDEKRWKQATGTVKQKGGSVTLSVLTDLLTTLAKNALGLP